MNTQKEKIDLSSLERIAELIFLFLMFMLFGFLAYHQYVKTGFFTEQFGTWEMLCLYVPMFAAMIPLGVRAWTGQRQPARPFEVISNLLLAGGSFWLLSVFPFDYTHLADALPNALTFLLAWVTDDIARVVFVIQIVVGLSTAVVTMWKFAVTQQESEWSLKQRTI